MCFAEKTKIELADGSNLKIEDIRIGDMVITETGITHIMNTWCGIENEMINILAEDGKIICVTKNQPMLTEKGVIRAEKVSAGMLLKCSSGFSKVNQVEKKEQMVVYNLDADGKSIYADGFLCGDFIVQNSLV